MNKNLVLRSLGLVLLSEIAGMVPSFLISLSFQEPDFIAFLITIIIGGSAGAVLVIIPARSNEIGYKEGFAVATFGWLLLSIVGSIPYLISGTFDNFIDAFFETMSGFTTTGASTIPDLETLPHGILFWRSTTHWLGGMGTIVLVLALFPSLKIAGVQLYRAEVPGPAKSKVLPRIVQTSRELYKIYLIITVTEVLFLKAAGMPWFDSFIHTFGTVATGGFSSKNASISAYNSLTIEIIIIFFMIVSGMNFALHYRALRGNFAVFWKDSETRLYLAIIIITVLLIGGNLIHVMGYSPAKAFRDALFQSASIITTTGFATADFNRWPDFSKFLLLVLMLIGGCAGSTGGGIKNVRLLIIFKSAFKQIIKLIHPQAVIPIRLGREVLPQELVESTQSFFFLYILVLVFATVFISSLGIDLISSLSAVAATLGNIGPGLGLVGPATTYAAIPLAGKLILAICMLIGRLEVYTVLVLFSIRFWR